MKRKIDDMKNTDNQELSCNCIEKPIEDTKEEIKRTSFRYIIQFSLIFITILTIFTFYQEENINYLVKCFVTMFLIVANCVYNYHFGLKSGTEMLNKHEKLIREHYRNKLDKAIEMIVAEKKLNER